MAKKRDDGEPLDRIFDLFDDAPPGLHDVDPPAAELPPGLPGPLIELYARCDGARLFVDSIEILPSHEVKLEHGRWGFAVIDGEGVPVDHKGKAWRTDASIEDDVCEATRIDRWLAGQLDALELVFDRDGEYADDVFDEDGEILAIVREKQLRASSSTMPPPPPRAGGSRSSSSSKAPSRMRATSTASRRRPRSTRRPGVASRSTAGPL